MGLSSVAEGETEMPRRKVTANFLLLGSIIAFAWIANSARAEKTYDFFYMGVQGKFTVVESIRPVTLGLLPYNKVFPSTKDKLMRCRVQKRERPVRFLDTGDETIMKSVYLYCAEGIFRIVGVGLR